MVETWEVFFMLLGLYSYINRKNIITGILFGIAGLIKLIPLIFLFYFFIKSKKIFMYSITIISFILLLSSFIYSFNIGINYPYYIYKDIIKPSPHATNAFDNTAFIELFHRIITGFNRGAEINNIRMLFVSRIIKIILLIVSIVLIINFISKSNNTLIKLLEFSFIISIIPIISPNFGSNYHGVLLLPAYIFILIILKILKYPKIR